MATGTACYPRVSMKLLGQRSRIFEFRIRVHLFRIYHRYWYISYFEYTIGTGTLVISNIPSVLLEALTGKDTFSCIVFLYKYFSSGTLVLLISGLQIINEVLNVVHHTFSCKNPVPSRCITKFLVSVYRYPRFRSHAQIPVYCTTYRLLEYAKVLNS